MDGTKSTMIQYSLSYNAGTSVSKDKVAAEKRSVSECVRGSGKEPENMR